jgi:hypothetical protein
MASTTIFAGFGCTSREAHQEDVSNKNFVQQGDPNKNQEIGDSNQRITVLGNRAFDILVAVKKINSTDSTPAREESLIAGLPNQMLNTPIVFGSVITQVSDLKNKDLGGLKLSDIPPFQSMLIPRKLRGDKYIVAVVDCSGNCMSSGKKETLLEIPVKGVDEEKKLIFLDLASLGDVLDLTALRKGDSTLALFKGKSSKTVRFDYSNKTLVFDVEANLVEKNTTDLNAPETIITQRWYIKSADFFNPGFDSRKATAGVGFFMTDRSTSPLVQRWDFDLKKEQEGIKYYLKNIPQENHQAFAGAFDEWNEKLLPVVGKKFFTYEFISPEDPRSQLLITGDVRYNILEWDLINKAGYGGLGPSLANQYTGEIFTANVLVQGPTIIDLYKKWFNVNQDAFLLRAEGKLKEADLLLASSSLKLTSHVNQFRSRTFGVKLGKKIQMTIRSQDPRLEDGVMAKDGFDPIPEGYTYEAYMEGYFHDLVAHELGHNIGLRHNFKGSLGAATGEPVFGEVSRSIMEYLGRGFRHLDRVGEYDVMAIAYGYKGVTPVHIDWFCTDEDTASVYDSSHSAECTPDDATNDPFGYYEGRLQRALDLLLGRGQQTIPQWTVDDMVIQLEGTLSGLGSYVASAEETASGWTNFFNHEGRPQLISEIKNYVLKEVKAMLCDPRLVLEIERKETLESKEKAKANLAAIQAKAIEVFKPVFSSSELACGS